MSKNLWQSCGVGARRHRKDVWGCEFTALASKVAELHVPSLYSIVQYLVERRLQQGKTSKDKPVPGGTVWLGRA